MAKITFNDKYQTGSYDATKFNAQDANEIKNSVNFLYTQDVNFFGEIESLAGTTNSELLNFEFAPGLLKTNGDRIEFAFGGKYGNGNGDKQLGFSFGGGGYGFTANTNKGGSFFIDGYLVRISNSEYKLLIKNVSNNYETQSVSCTTLPASGNNFTTASQIMRIRGGGVDAGDVVLQMGIAKYIPYYVTY